MLDKDLHQLRPQAAGYVLRSRIERPLPAQCAGHGALGANVCVGCCSQLNFLRGFGWRQFVLSALAGAWPAGRLAIGRHMGLGPFWTGAQGHQKRTHALGQEW